MEHTVIGAGILAPLFKNAPNALSIVRSHHERFDGGGFPDKLAGDDIPLFARVVCVADAFDAMTSGRTYRKARQAGEALDEMRRSSGSQFDPEIVDAFIKAHEGNGALPIATPTMGRRSLPEGIAWTPPPE
jgi:HD-GYP domain-containing protein (c-di-GMP phosphodiesterase class II)